MLVLLFLLFSLAYFFVTKGKIAINSYPDELRYLQYAVSIAEGHGISLHGETTNYTHVLYSFLLAPIIAIIPSPFTQIKCIALLNSVLMASVCFPVALLSRKIIKTPHLALIPVVLSLLLPETLYAATMMSENLYYPLGAWTLLFLHKSVVSPRVRNSIVSGAACGLLTLTKISGVSFPIGFALLSLVLLVRGPRQGVKRGILLLAVFGASVFVVYGGFSLPIMIAAQTADGYGSQTFAIFVWLSRGRLPFFFYGLLHNIAFVSIALLVLPLLIPVSFFECYEEKERKLLLIGLFILFTLVFIVSATITFPEDINYDSDTIRVHFRYYSPLFSLFITCLFSLLEKRPRANRKQIVRFVAILAMLSLSVAVMGGVRYASHVDSITFYAWSLAEGHLAEIPAWARGCLLFSVVFLPSIALFALFINRKQAMVAVTSCVLAAPVAFNGFCYAWWYHANFLQNDTLMSQIAEITEIVEENDDETPLYAVQPNIYVWGESMPMHYMDTFLRGVDGYIEFFDYLDQIEKPTFDLEDSLFTEPGLYVIDPTHCNVNLDLNRYEVLYNTDFYLVLKLC